MGVQVLVRFQEGYCAQTEQYRHHHATHGPRGELGEYHQFNMVGIYDGQFVHGAAEIMPCVFGGQFREEEAGIDCIGNGSIGLIGVDTIPLIGDGALASVGGYPERKGKTAVFVFKGTAKQLNR